MPQEIRSSEPLSPSQLNALTDVAADMGFRHRLIAEVLPYTGLTFGEFCHLRKEWCRATDPNTEDFNIIVPLASPCTGTLRTEPSGRYFEMMDEPCWLCREDGEWKAPAECRHRTIPVPEPAQKALKLCFDRLGIDSLPFTVSSNFYQWMDDLAERAGLSRTFGFRALRRTFGTVLIRKGFTSTEVAKYLGLKDRYKTEPMYDALDKPVDWETRPKRALSDAELTDALQRLTRRLGRRPKTEDIEDNFEYSFKPLYNHFGGLHGALEAAGIEFTHRNPREIPDAELVDELQQLSHRLGRPPFSSEMAEQGEYSKSVYFDHFGSWDAALREAGLDPGDLPSQGPPTIGRENLLTDLHRLADELGRPPTSEDLRVHGEYSSQPYYSMFGGLQLAREAAGIGHPSQSTND